MVLIVDPQETQIDAIGPFLRLLEPAVQELVGEHIDPRPSTRFQAEKARWRAFWVGVRTENTSRNEKSRRQQFAMHLKN